MITDELLAKAIELISKRDVNYAAFFDKLASPEWIRPLQGHGFFKRPPPIQREGDWVRFPVWPESRYLARVSELSPALVVEIVEEIETTDNPRVHEDYIDIACAVEGDLAVRVARKEIAWLRRQEQLYFGLGIKYSRLISDLAHGGKGEIALELSESLLNIKLVSDVPTARLRNWDYDQILRGILPDLVDACGLAALTMIVRLVEKSVAGSSSDKPQDYSFIWRRDIGPASSEESTRAENVRNALVSAARDAASRILEEDPSLVTQMVDVLESRQWLILRRLALHLLSLAHEGNEDLIEERVADPLWLSDVGLRHELLPLLKENWRRLSEDSRAAVMQYVEDDGQRKANDGDPADGARRVLGWLSVLGDQLDGEWKARYEELQARYSVGHALEAWSGVITRWGSVSPSTSAELNAMSTAELVAFLHDWRSDGGFDSPSVDGLRGTLGEAVAMSPDRFARDAMAFAATRPGYVAAILNGLRQAVKAGELVAWSAVLSLCQYVLSSPTVGQPVGRDASELFDDDQFASLRRGIVELVVSGLESGASEFAIEFRLRVWSLISTLANDPEPTPEFELTYGGSNMDPITLAINTTRGQAIHAVVRYALWVRRQTDPAGSAKSMEDIPEVRDTLDQHLDPTVDESAAIRSIYGEWTPWLLPLDSVWFSTAVPRIFPHDPALAHLWGAAWEGYVLANPPYTSVFSALVDEYAFAIAQLPNFTNEQRHLADPRERLGEHLMTLYWSNELTLTSHGGLLQSYFVTADPTIRSHAMAFLGRSLCDASPVKDETLSRLRELWAIRVDVNRSLKRAERQEMSAFGWWFTSKKFEDEWVLERLEESLHLYSTIDADHEVVSRLAELAANFPMEALRCVRLLIEGDVEGWQIDYWGSELRKLFGVTLALDESSSEARQLINDLGARGFLVYLQLIAEADRR